MTFSLDHQITTDVQYVRNLSFYDFNHDGILDLFFTGKRSYYGVFATDGADLGQSSVTPTMVCSSYSTSLSVTSYIVDDLNDNNLNEVFYSINSTYVYRGEQTSSTSYTVESYKYFGLSNIDFKVVDINQDGDLDLFVLTSLSETSGHYYYFDSGIGNSILLSSEPAIGYIEFVDLDQDGITEYVGWDGDEIYEAKLVDGTFVRGNTYFNDIYNENISAIAFVDINHDNYLDIVYTQEGGVGVLYNNQDNTFTYDSRKIGQTSYITSSGTKEKIVAADFNNDGLDDVAILNPGYTYGKINILESKSVVDSLMHVHFEPTKEGYTFAGWYQDEALTIPFVEDETSFSTSITLYAKWVDATYELTYLDRYGEVISSVTVGVGEDLTALTHPSAPTIEGLTFIGWQNMVGVMPEQDLNVRAMYSSSTITITLDTNGGDALNPIYHPFQSSFEPEYHYYNNMPKEGLYIIQDVNGDGLLDLITSSSSTTSLGHLGYYSDFFHTSYNYFVDFNASIYGSYTLLKAYDWDLDGTNELFAAYNNIIIIYRVNNNGTLTFLKQLSAFNQIKDFYLDDANNDGYQDIVVYSNYSTNRYLSIIQSYNDGANYYNFNLTPTYVNMQGLLPKLETDAGTYYGVYVTNNTENPYSEIRFYHYTELDPYGYLTVTFDKVILSATLKDVDDDGHLDLIAGFLDQSVQIWKGDGLGHFQHYQTIDATFLSYFGHFDFIDIDNDLDLDMVVSHYSNGLSFYLNDGTGKYTLSDITTGSVTYWSTEDYRIGDFNQDGFDDILLMYANNSLNHYLAYLVNKTEEVASTMPTLPTPTRTGYSFVNWTSDEAGETVFSSAVYPSENTTIYAQWEINQYTIHFEENGGSLVEDITEDYNTEITEPLEPTKTGNTFGGWYTDEALTESYVFTAMPATDLTLYAKWTLNTYTVNFIENGGTTVNDTSYTYGSDIDVPTNPVKLGFVFIGWYSDIELTQSYIFGAMPAMNITLYAKWEMLYDITLVANGGTYTGLPTISASSSWTEIDFKMDNNTGCYTTYGVGDFNQDGYMDFASTTNWPFDSYLYVFFNNQDGTFTKTVVANLTSNAFLVGDYNNDNYPDMIVIGYDSPNMALLLNDQNGGFTTIAIAGGMSTTKVRQTDINNDGYLDFISQEYVYSDGIFYYGVQIYLNNQNNTFSKGDFITVQTGATFSFEVNDFNQDGYVDIIAFTLSTNHVYLFTNDGSMSFTLSEISYSFVTENNLYYAIYDYDHDGDLDLILQDLETRYFHFYNNDGTGIFVESTETYYYNSLIQYAVSKDMNQDGVEDLVFPNYGLSILYFDDEGNITDENYWNPSFDLPIFIEDFNKDGDNDVLISVFGSDFLIYDQTSTIKIASVPTPTKTGYSFIGWYTDETLTTALNTSTFLLVEDTSLYAKYQINQYTISFEENGGTTVANITMNYNSDVSSPIAPTKTGYFFDGWYSDSALTNVYTFSTMPSSNITVYAKWTINQYTVEYVDYDGTVLQTADYDYGTDLSGVTAPADPSRVGYSFSSWSGTVPSTMGTTTVTITATYTINQYTVEYVDYDGTILQTADYDYGTDLSSVSAPADPTRVGYSFSSWSGTLPSTMGTTKVTITASYTINQYTVEYVDYDGTVIQTADYDYGTDLSIVEEPSDPERTGYSFSSWVGTLPDTMGTSKVTITASYTINQYTVEYVDYDGTVLQTQDYDYGTDLSVVEEPSDPERTGYSFTGWDINLPTQLADSNITVQAVYQINQYTVEYVDYDGTVLQTEDYDYGTDLSNVEEPADPERTGYSFSSWVGTLPDTMGTTKVTITATYTINQYTVEYVDYNGTVLQTQDYDYGTDLSNVEEPADPERTGYSFSSWSGTVPATMGTTTVTITATYTINQYTVEYVDYDGTVLQTQDYDYNTDLSIVEEPSDPDRTGYSFSSWVGTLPDTMGTSKVTITASYTINQYTVEYVDYDGTVIQTSDYDYLTDLSIVTEPEGPERTGYTFNVWVGTLPSTMGTSKVTITASYTINQYTVEYVDYDGTVLQTSDYDYLTDLSIVEEPADPERTGYSFSSWSGTVPATMGTTTVTITAIYTINQYTVEYVDYDGTVLQTQDYDYLTNLSIVTEPLNPERTGYTFDVWVGSLPDTMGTTKVTIMASYTINQYTVEYVDYDGTVIQTSDYDYLTDLSVVVEPSDPERTGYSFIGWDIHLPTHLADSNITVQAIYQINQYTVEYVDYDGAVIQTSDYDYLTELSIVVEPSDPERTGYSFSGWVGSLPDTMGTTTVTITASYTINQYTVEYVDYDGTVIQTDDYDYDTDLSIVIEPSDPSRLGYTFTGWEGSLPDSMGTSKVTMTASYTINQYTIEYLDYNGRVIQTEKYDFNADLSNVTPPTNPSRLGYTFVGWVGSLPETMGVDKITILASYTINQYTIYFNTFGGSSVLSITLDYNAQITVPENPTKEGYVFNGWSQVLPDIMPSHDITMDAYWLKVETVSDTVETTSEGLFDAINQEDVLGSDSEVTLNVNILPSEEVNQTESEAASFLAQNEISIKNIGYVYIDIEIVLTSSDHDPVYITELTQPVLITISIPEEQLGYKNYQIIRIHDGVAEVLESAYNELDGTLTFSTDQFSTYVIIYDTSSSGLWWLLLLLIIPVGYVGYKSYKKIKKS